MSINFNVEPYYDDYNEDKKFYRILFKPGVSVQARELSQMQSIIQKQVERHGSHIFKDGSRVTGGEFGYTDKFHAVKLQSRLGTTAISDYIDQFVGLEIRGEDSGVTARVISYAKATAADPDTLFVKYTSTGDDKSTITFQNGENLFTNDTLVNGIISGLPIAQLQTSNGTAIGSSASIERGVYYVKGHFVLVDSQRIVLDKYSNSPSYRVGLEVTESVVSADDDQSLLDTAQNSPNFSARGADRYTIELKLAVREIDDEDDNNFIELERITEGRLQGKIRTSEYSQLELNMARRTYDESGDYVTKPFQYKLKETLNDGLNNGVYFEGSTTDSGNTPSEELMTLQMSTGKAYVRGYEITLNQPAFIDIEKPREFVEVDSSGTTMELGNYVRVNNVFGSPDVSTQAGEITPFNAIGLYSEATDTLGESSGNSIGVARARAFELENANQSGEVDAFGADAQYRLYLFDIKMFTEITLDANINTQSGAIYGSVVRGLESQAVGYINSATANGSNVLKLTSVVGEFREQESLVYSYDNYATPLGNTTSVVNHAFENVKQCYMDADPGYQFSSDLVLESSFQLSGSASITGNSVVGLNAFFSDEVKVGDALSMPTGTNGASEIRFVESVGNNLITLVDDGGSHEDVQSVNIFRQRAFINDQEKHIMIRQLNKDFVREVSSVSLGAVYRQYVRESNSSGAVSIDAGSGNTFLGLDNDTFTVSIISAGTGSGTAGQVVNVESDEVSVSPSGSSLTISSPGIFGEGAFVKIIASLAKPSQTRKIKTYRPSEIVEVLNKSAETESVVYGTSSQHKEISLGVADAFKVLAVYESTDPTTAASIPSITAGSFDGTFVKGEVVRGATSGATAIIVNTTSPIRYVPQNDIAFSQGEVIAGIDSGATAAIVSLTAGSKNVTNNYLLDTGQRDNYYDIAKLVRKVNSPAPKGRLTVVFDYFEHDTGDFFTVDSYAGIDYKDIPTYTATRIDPEVRIVSGLYDLRSSIDFRPRVADITTTNSTDVTGAKIVQGYSFDFESRAYTGTGSSMPSTPADNSTLTYDFSYFLARRDALFLTSEGTIKLVKGLASESPTAPEDITNAMRIADIDMPPYVIDVADVNITKALQRRYTMKDIGLLERRIGNIEYYTSLSLLETSAETLQIKDANGLDRFKSGFLVDNFGGHKTGDIVNRDYRCAIDMQNRVLRPKYKMKNIALEEINTTSDERLANHYVSSNNIITLPYDEVESITQPYATTVENLNPVLNFSWAGTLRLEPSSDEWFEIERLPDIVNNVEGNFDTIVAQNKNAIGTVWNAPVTDWTGVLVNEQQSTRRETSFQRSRQLGVTRGRAVLTRTTADEIGVQTRTGIETTVIEQIDIKSEGDRIVAESLVPYMRSREVLFEARGMKPFTRVYPFFDKVNVSNFVTPTSGSIISQEGADVTIPKSVDWNQIKVIQVSYDNNSGKDIDMVLSRSNDIKRPATWNSGVDVKSSFTLHNHKFSTIWNNYNSNNFDRARSKFEDAIVSVVRNGNWIEIVLDPKWRLSTDSKKGGWIWVDANEYRIWDSNGSTSSNGYMQYKNGAGDWVAIKSSSTHPTVKVGVNETWSEDEGANQNSNAFFARSIVKSTNRSVAEFNFVDAPLSPNKFGEGFYRFRFFDRNSDGALRGLQISEILFFDENYDEEQTYEWNIENSLIANVDHTEVVASYNMKNVTNLIDGGKRYDAELGTWVIDGVNYRSDTEKFSEATIASHTKGEAGVDIRVRGGFRTVETESVIERFAAPGTQQGDALVTDAGGFVSGIFLIPDPNVAGNPVFETGERLFRLSSDINNGEDSVVTFAQTNYTATGILQQKQETFTATRNGVLTTQAVSQETTITRQRDLGEVVTGWWDPLAQSIMPSTEGGEFITAVEVFFSAKDETIPVTCQLREMINGLPTRNVIPFGSKTIQPEEVQVSNDGSVGTTFTFDAPVFVKENVEICIVLMTDSDKYLAWISRMGEDDILGNRTVSEQPYLGVLFKSQNNSTWTAYDYEDLKFTVYRASFDISQNGIVELQNTEIPAKKLSNDPLTLTSGSSEILVRHDDHGMYDTSPGTGNYVIINGVSSGISGTLTSILETSDTSFTVEGAIDNSGFPTTEGVTHTFIIRSDIPEEAPDLVIKGTVVADSGAGTYTITPSSAITSSYPEGAIIEFYELYGFPLDEINNTPLKISNATLDSYVIDIDGYSATSSDSFGGNAVYATENAMINDYQLMVPVVNHPETQVRTQINFLTGTSPSGFEVSYGDYGEQQTILVDRVHNKKAGMIASSVNETENNEGDKSLSVTMTMSSSVENLSPVIDLERKSITTYANRLDSIKSSADTGALEYTPPTAPDGDSGEAVYITKRVQLQNPATALKVIIDAVRNPSAEIQVMYKVLRSDDSSEFDELGWNYFNLEGSTDTPVAPVSDRASFREYEYTADGIPEFISFAIKIKMNGTNTSEPPLIKDLRAIALAV